VPQRKDTHKYEHTKELACGGAHAPLLNAFSRLPARLVLYSDLKFGHEDQVSTIRGGRFIPFCISEKYLLGGVMTAEFALIISPRKAEDRLFRVSIFTEEKGQSASKNGYVNMPLLKRNAASPLHFTLFFSALKAMVAAQL